MTEPVLLVYNIKECSRDEEFYKHSKQLNAPIFSSKHRTNNKQNFLNKNTTILTIYLTNKKINTPNVTIN